MLTHVLGGLVFALSVASVIVAIVHIVALLGG